MHKRKKMEKEIREWFREKEQIPVNSERKRQSLEFLRLERKQLRLVPKRSYGKRVLEQAAYISPLAWIAQGLLVLLLGFSLNLPVWEQGDHLVVLVVCAPLIGITGFTEVLRSYRENVWELEQACRYNLRQLMGMRLLIFGTVDALTAALVFLGGIRLGIPVGQLLLFFLTPQLLSDCVYLYLISRFRRRFQGTVLVGAAVAAVVLNLWTADRMVMNPRLFGLVSGSAWPGIISFFSGALLAACCMKFLGGVDKEDEKWNFGWTV